MMRLAALTIAAAMLAPQALAASTTTQTLVAQCKHEAVQAHERAWRLEPALRPAIAAHRDLMSTACMLWLGAQDTETLLTQCLNQAASGPRHIERGHDLSGAYVTRQQELCRRLAASRGEKLVEVPGAVRLDP